MTAHPLPDSDLLASERGPSARLAGWIASLGYEDIPRDVVEHAKLCVLDAIGCGLFGASQPCGDISAAAMLDLCPDGPSTIWAGAGRTGAAEAALANGTAAHGFELDDIHVASVFHPGAVTVPAVWAAGEARRISGREALVAIVAGYEAGIRLGICAGVTHASGGYHATGTIGCVAAACGVGRALGLSAEETLHSLAIGATQAGALYCARTGAMAKRFHAGRAAHAGVLGGFLAARGFTGARTVLEDPNGGFLSTMAPGSDPARLLDGLGEEWETSKVGFKIYASCASMHTTIDALDGMMKRGLTARNLAFLTIRMSKVASNNVNWPYRPVDTVSAQMNGYYTAAVKLLDGEAFVDQYAIDRLSDPEILALIEKIKIIHDPELDLGGAAKRHTVLVEAVRTDGSRLEAKIDHRTGSAEKPLSREEVVSKFTRLAGKALGNEAVDRLTAEILDLEHIEDLAGLGSVLGGDAKPGNERA